MLVNQILKFNVIAPLICSETKIAQSVARRACGNSLTGDTAIFESRATEILKATTRIELHSGSFVWNQIDVVKNNTSSKIILQQYET